MVTSATVVISAGLISFARRELARPAQPQESQKETVVKERGRLSFETRCATCHGLDGRGGEHAPGIVDNSRVQSRKDPELAEVIRSGIPDKGMPSFHFLTNGQINALVQYIRTLGGKGKPANMKGDPAAGAKLFFGEARCADCHTMHGKGGFIASDLTEYGRTHTAEEARKVVLEPNNFLVPRWALVRVTTRSGEKFAGLVRDEDNFSIAILSEDGTFHLLKKSDIALITREPRSIMPDNYGKKLSSKQLDDLASFLVLGTLQPNLKPGGGRGKSPN
jgi:cytochrome c oxidase cbb3-type subunit 3